MRDPATLTLICGLPGAGKTTLARALATTTGAVRCCPDEWLTDLELSLYDEPLRTRLEARLIGLADELLRAGVDVILEFGFWGRSERDDLRELARRAGVRVELHLLDLPFDELWARVERRNVSPMWRAHPVTQQQLRSWSSVFQRPSAEELAAFDRPRPGAGDDRTGASVGPEPGQ